jgi:hypothetical protein
MSSSFRDLRVWQQAIDLALETYQGTAAFPRHEIYGLAQQMRRAAVSIPSNIAEGKGSVPIKTFGVFCFRREVPCWNSKRRFCLLESYNICPRRRVANYRAWQHRWPEVWLA